MKMYPTILSLACLLSMSASSFADKYEHDDDSRSYKYEKKDKEDKEDKDKDKDKDKDNKEFKCKKPMTELSVVYNGEATVDVVVYDKKNRDSVLYTFSTVEKGDILELKDLAEVKKDALFKIYSPGTNDKVGESLFNLQCKDKDMNEPTDCGNTIGDGKKKDKHDQYTTDWLFNGLTDKKGNSFRCDLPETHLMAPELTLIGSPNIDIEIGDDFVDPGAIGIDDFDGDLSAYIMTQSNLNTLQVGVYTITYSLTDFDGNTSTIERKVSVSDAFIRARSLQRQIAQSSDDAEQTESGAVNLNSSDLELPFDDLDLLTNTVGLRFSNINIPHNAEITNAYIQFTVDEATDGVTELTINADKNNNSSTFYSSSFNISNREKTDGMVSWMPAPWNVVGESGIDQQTPDLSGLIQEVLTESGYLNSLSIILTGTGKRVAESYNGDAANAPTLYVEYISGSDVQIIPVSANIKRILPVNSSFYELVNAPDQGIVEIIEETGDFVYKANLNAVGSDIVKFRSLDTLSESQLTILQIQHTPSSVVLNGAEQVDFSSNLPLIILDTNNVVIPDDPKIKGVMTVIPVDHTGRSSLSALPEYSDFMEIEIRGSSSVSFPKNGFGVDTETFDGEDNDVSLLGMPEEHKWVLHGPYTDKSLMRNYIAYNKTRDLGGYSAVRTKYVEVLMQDGNAYSYHGVYVFMEKIKRDKNRLDISKLKSDETELPDIEGGYILAHDKVKADDFAFRTAYLGNSSDRDFTADDACPDNELVTTGTGDPASNISGFTGYSRLVVDYPKADDINCEQKNYIVSYMNEFEDALSKPDFNDPESVNYYGNYIKPESFAKHLLSRELFRDVDTWVFSEFLHKDKGEKLSMLPVWDFNLGMGNANYGHSLIVGDVEGWYYDYRNTGSGGWMNRLMKDPAFREMVLVKWQEMRENEWSDANMNQYLDDTKALLQEAQARNFERWPVLGVYVWPNVNACGDDVPRLCNTWDEEVDEHLRKWLIGRLQWMEMNLN